MSLLFANTIDKYSSGLNVYTAHTECILFPTDVSVFSQGSWIFFPH